ncbi:hypothetical protein [Anaerolinea sp.]|uniref:hypothetical protein n=1 Tax=Anaerolinea sp. TaxID=1872519 RepID=UPI002ACD96D6|nr:hypothetical protein [Anaerolinea sp.]
MSTFEDLFSGVNFKSTVTRYCQQIGWKVAEVDDRHAMLKFTMESGRNQVLWILRYDKTLEFSVPSMAQFDREEDIPHFLSTVLMRRSSQKKIGFWCIEEINGRYIYSCMHNAEIQLMDIPYFRDVVVALISECDEFEGILLDMLNRQ